ILFCSLPSQVILVASEEEVECVPGFQEKNYELEYGVGFRKEEALLKVHFDDCAGNENVKFEVSHPYLTVDQDGSLVALRDITDTGSFLFIHGRTAHADDMAEVKVIGAPHRIPQSLKEILGLGQSPAYSRQRRSLLAPPMYVAENDRGPFPKFVGKVISSDPQEANIFRLTGKGADQDPKGVFSISRHTGEVYVSHPLDRERIATYHMQVETTDLSGKIVEGPVALDVFVIDQNDNRPIFKEGPYVGQVLEGSPTVFGLPPAPRLYQNSVPAISVPLSDCPGAESGQGEAGAWLSICFYRQGVMSPATLLATAGRSDVRPEWGEASKTAEVSMDGTTVMRMTAYDADDPNTDNAVLRYNIVRQTPDKPSPNMFYIDPEKGDIVTVISPGLLDRETMPSHQYELEIVAKDMAGSDVGLTGTATATIIIADKNDHPPEFTKSMFLAAVNEGTTGVIVNLTVEDKDDPTTGAWRAVYSIINGNPGQSFKVNTNPSNNEGMLSVVKPLDYEISAFHTLLIKVENEDPLVPDVSYGPSSTATVQVTVLDVNEGPIFYPDPMRVTKRENIPIGSPVTTLNASDPDSLQTQSIKFAVLKDPAGWLGVHPVKGTVNTTAILDRESPYVQDNTYTAVFMAMDNGNPPATGTGTLVITLEDDNDNPPSVFPDVARVCEDSKDLNVVIVGGRDKDISPNADPFKIELGKQPGLEKTWKVTKVNSTHSQVSLLHNLKRANYNLPLIVTDSGKPPLSNSTEIKVQVCTCKKNKMDCSSAGTLHISVALVLCFSFFALFCEFSFLIFTCLQADIKMLKSVV
ncbi:CAD13 protein, partial [Atractosteus spatula]|nr:CAD13 protein [Atractosteus spatula]